MLGGLGLDAPEMGVLTGPLSSYDLARLRRNGLITRRPHASTYDTTPDGPLFAAGQPQAPTQPCAALTTI